MARNNRVMPPLLNDLDRVRAEINAKESQLVDSRGKAAARISTELATLREREQRLSMLATIGHIQGLR